MTEKLRGPGLIRARVFGHTRFVEKDDLFAVEFVLIVGITSSIFKNFVELLSLFYVETIFFIEMAIYPFFKLKFPRSQPT